MWVLSKDKKDKKSLICKVLSFLRKCFWYCASFSLQKEWENQSPQRAMKSELHRGVKPIELHEARTRIVKSVWTIELIMFSTWETQNNCSKLLFEFLKVSRLERDWKSAKKPKYFFFQNHLFDWFRFESCKYGKNSSLWLFFPRSSR